MPKDVSDLFAAIELPRPAPVPLMPLHHQVAQKLHALTSPDSDRVRDLIDLQVIMSGSDVDLAQTRQTCERLFAYRKQQAWPPVIAKGEGWAEAYEAQRGSLEVLTDVDAAIAWANDLVERIASA